MNNDIDLQNANNIEYIDWKINGTGAFSFLGCSVTSAVRVDGKKSTTDTVLNSKVVNIRESSPVALDLDIHDQFATLHEMTLAIVEGDGDIAFKGNIAPIIIAKDAWLRTTCINMNEVNNTDLYFSAESTALITDVKWNERLDSPTLTELKSISEENGGKLSISVTFFFSPRALHVFKDFRLAYVVGAIGVAYKDESTSLIKNRVLSYEGIVQPDIHLSVDNPCLQHQLSRFDTPVQMYKAPFQAYSDRIITVDFRNAIPLNLNGGSLRNLGRLFLGIFDKQHNCIELIGNYIPYLEANWLSNGGIYDYVLRDDQHHLLQHSPLVVVRSLAISKDFIVFPDQSMYPKMSNSFTVSSCTIKHFLLQLMLQETQPEYRFDQEPLLRTSSIYSSRNDDDITLFPNLFSLPDDRCNQCPVIETDFYFNKLLLGDSAHLEQNMPQRPLMKQTRNECTCTVDELKTQLQTAIQLEFATIPPYLTALYSIKSGSNQEAFNRIKMVVIQEMFHMTQVANILIAIGGVPIINSSEAIPSYPTRLPGGVLPNLNVTLEKLSLEYVYSVFMGIEIPYRLENGTDVTIGKFYNEIQDCIYCLGSSLTFLQNADKQVNLASPNFNIIIINDSISANDAINEIVQQGEGSKNDPTQGGNHSDPAHFFTFEEIVCSKSIVIHPDNATYCYSGAPIPFDAQGVWPMQSNPSKEVIKDQPNCQNVMESFSAAYKTLLDSLQYTFNGHPDNIHIAISNMFALSESGRAAMTQPISDSSNTTCGPVWSI